MCTKYWLTAFQACLGNSVVRSTDRPAMTIAVDLGGKAVDLGGTATKQTKSMHIQNLDKFCKRVLEILSANTKYMTNERTDEQTDGMTDNPNTI